MDEALHELDPNQVTIADIFRILLGIKKDLAQNRNDLADKTKVLEDKVLALEVENKQLKTKLLNVERKLKKNNIFIFGLDPEDTDVTNAVIKVVNKKLNVALTVNDINNCYQIKNVDGKPILLELISYLKKSEIFNKVSKLKGTGIFFSDDLTYQDRQDKKQLLEHAKLAKAKNLDVKIKRGSIVVNGEQFTLSDLQTRDELTVEETPLDTEIERSNSETSNAIANPSPSRNDVVPPEEKVRRVQKIRTQSSSCTVERITRNKILHNIHK